MKIIIKNTNVVFTTKEVIDLTNEFTIENEGYAYKLKKIGEEYGIYVSSTFNITKLVDISSYIGRIINVEVPKYTTSFGGNPNFASIVITDDQNIIKTIKQMSMAESTPASGGHETLEVVIPEGAKYMGVTVFNETKSQEFGYKLSCVVA